MHAFAEVLPEGSLLLRAGPRAHAVGDEWELAAIAVPQGKTAIIKGLAAEPGQFQRAYFEAVKRCLADLGFERMRWVRMKPGELPRIVEIQIKKTGRVTE